MSLEPINIAVFSSDRTLTNAIRNSSFGGRSVKYFFSQNASDVDGLDNCSLVVYDLDLVNNDPMQASEDISLLKRHSKSKPVFLIGERREIANVVSFGELESSVSRTIAKPLMRSELNLHVNTAISSAAVHQEDELKSARNATVLRSMLRQREANQLARAANEAKEERRPVATQSDSATAFKNVAPLKNKNSTQKAEKKESVERVMATYSSRILKH